MSFRVRVTAFARSMNTVLRWIDRLFAILTILALLTIVAAVLLQVVARYALPTAPVWTEELSRYLFVYLVVLSSGSVIARNRNVRLELFQHRLPARWVAAYHLTCHLLVGLFALCVLPYAWQYAMIGRAQTSPAMGLPMVYVFMATVLFSVLVAFYSLVGGIQAMTALLNGEMLDWK